MFLYMRNMKYRLTDATVKCFVANGEHDVKCSTSLK